ncbi:hydrogenase maturation nickel metallochaperone HypA [Saccharomonospora viridis]|jgi:hydrogenase nickel incorporation protein HypA/HybF|uniref:Hydrogenase maturation factor HypA n=2 Tax=Saccharomonospora viridis TaxID=1852 RepID=C7MWK3_SACVD|nr:hydrogenase maturation nickel metallochaperone HypA [Saccharomonospora viridis]ACU95862.1 hydrogenase nickel insertion protein HypA [Saccharomonospora viridis DSM 43017]KHF45650.1 hydrogenase nickel incorporation protein HypA [Saccharomonospora viridis]SFP72302.1 hydrogenase nickel incorporation protein HypA/HybF [Saccharomonospora viridis]
MHELSITQSVVDAVVEHTAGARVLSVRLEIGALSGVEADAVRFCFDAVTRGTPVDGAELVIEHVPGEGRCGSCGADVRLTSFLDVCACGSTDVEVTSGQQLRIRDVEVVRDVRNMRM